MPRAFLMQLIVAALLTQAALASNRTGRSVTLTPEAVNNAQWFPRADAGKLSPVILKAQVLLDRAGFSPGVIDARDGENFEKALSAYQHHNSLKTTGTLDEATWNRLTDTSNNDVVRSYTISVADVKGPFLKRLPRDFEKMADLDWLGYRSHRELLAETFHMSEELLSALNERVNFARADTKLVVANVDMMDVERSLGDGSRGTRRKTTGSGHIVNPRAERVEVNKSERSVRVFGQDGNLLAYYPASIGSTEKPAPSGTFEVRKVVVNPTYRYDPKYAFKGQKAKEPVEIAPGPNNPVGLVWIALSAESYGIHGTPDPERVSKTESHGCIRLTNWDALALARLVRKGTKVEFVN